MYSYQERDGSILHVWAEYCASFLKKRQAAIPYLISKSALEQQPFNMTFIEIHAKSLVLLGKIDDAEKFFSKHKAIITHNPGLQISYFDLLVLNKQYPEAFYHAWESIVDSYDEGALKYFSETLNHVLQTDRSLSAALEILDVEVDVDPLSRILFAFSDVKVSSEDQKFFGNQMKASPEQNIKKSKFVGLPNITLQPRVLIVAETSIPQCYFYRVLQKKEIFSLIGVSTTLVSWASVTSAFSMINTHTHLILYRVPYRKEIEELTRQARSLGCVVYYDIDDLIFDVDNYGSYLSAQSRIDGKEMVALLSGAEDYRQMMCFADYLIGSTVSLCQRMSETFGKTVYHIDNAVTQTQCKEASNWINLGPEDHVKIVYGSGSRTHDEDLKLVERALVQVLQMHPKVTLVLVGPLRLSESLREVGDRIIRLPLMPRDEYMQVLKRCEISIAPLASNIFNNCKSSIKLLEAAACGVATVASPTEPFQDARRRGVPVMLAEAHQDWVDSLSALIKDCDLRAEMGAVAMSSVAQAFSYDAIAESQYRDLLSKRGLFHLNPASGKKKIMIVNLFWRPMSFGGATLVAENLAEEIFEVGEFEVAVCTGDRPDSYGEGVRRDKVDRIDVFRILSGKHGNNEWLNREGAAYFRDVLSYAKPDLVHFHSVQGMGVEMVTACIDLDIPYIVTVHDAWWLCARQFLIRPNGTFCGQTSIDTRVCAGCVEKPEFLEDRRFALMGALEKASAIIAPSSHWRNFYIQNGISQEKIVHIENGIRAPRPVAAMPHEKPRFGFVGGMQIVKGYDNVRRAFDSIESDNWEIHFFDASTKLGGTPFSIPQFGRGDVFVHAGYSQDEIDEAFARFDALLFPSLWPESFGLSVREAIARGKWVITTNAGGQCEPIVDGVNGKLIPLDDDGTALTAAISDFIEREHYTSSSGKFCEVTTVQSNAQETCQLYHKILGF